MSMLDVFRHLVCVVSAAESLALDYALIILG